MPNESIAAQNAVKELEGYERPYKKPSTGDIQKNLIALVLTIINGLSVETMEEMTTLDTTTL